MQTIDDQTQSFVLNMYRRSFHNAFNLDYDIQKDKKQILKIITQSNIKYSNIKSIVHQTKPQWILELVEITNDIKTVYQQSQLFTKKLQDRAQSHFNEIHKLHFIKESNRSNSQSLKNVIRMYKQTQNVQQNNKFSIQNCNSILQNSILFMGLTKGNGVLINPKTIATCAHVLMTQNNRKYKYKCFINGNKSYGIVRIQPNHIFQQQDVAFCQIIQFNGPQIPINYQLKMNKQINFGKQFKTIRCIQLGLLFNNEPGDQFTNVFETAQGFIQRSQYQNQNDTKLKDQMGLLIHDCYGLWGTSGSPLWTQKGQLIGIHNAWNQNAQNITMIVHDDQSSKCRVIRQYERRAVSVHVIMQLFVKFIQGNQS